ncbi:hypothetical protein [Halorubrum lipolyticum]|uniref:hypothetical protein n=1 Tax=Halorubrum lipolyticum TaxID=368624 RepID=UPI0011CBFAA4|nr:hypothetical protein [Halorubrum lipolyticum]
MNRREALFAIGSGGAVGGGMLAGSALYGSSDLALEPANGGSVVRKDGERIDSLANAVSPVENDDAIVGISMPDRATVQRVAVEVVWGIQRDGLWSDVTIELEAESDLGTTLNPGRATAYNSTWGRAASPADGSTSPRRRYGYPRGTTAGRTDTALTVHPGSDPEGALITLEARLSARSLTGTRVELTAPDELNYSPE